MTSVPKNILVCAAWPYVNNRPHIGHIAGCFLPADIFARYQRLAGNNVLMVSGADTHGTPVSLAADKEQVPPEKIIEMYQPVFLDTFQKLGVTFDLFTTTHTENHIAVAHMFFTDLLAKGYLERKSSKQLYDKQASRFLPDRYVEGECPHCGFAEARGDQCDNCSKTYEAIELKNPVSKMTGSRDLEVRDTEHFYLALDKLNEPLLDWIRVDKQHWRRHVYNFSKGELEKRELRGRAITRDLDWGISIPVDGYDDKRIYVWFEAVMGYYSAAREWAQLVGEPDAYKLFWEKDKDPEARSYYFLGKDNISFHTIMWPGILTAKGGLHLPFDVPANEFLNSYGSKLSKSRGVMIDAQEVVTKYQPDAWRYALCALAPETSDSDFTWEDFLEKVNNELVANWGNLANRILGFTYKRFDGKIPEYGTLSDDDTALLTEVKGGFERVGALYEKVQLKSALEETRRLSQRVNQYLNDFAPWKTIKEDEAAAARSVYVSLQCIDWLKTMFAPVLPFSSQLIHETLGYEGQLFGRQYTEMVNDSVGQHQVLRYDQKEAIGRWEPSTLKPGQAMREPQAPFQKLDPKDVLPGE